jgi:hypothetical protein
LKIRFWQSRSVKFEKYFFGTKKKNPGKVETRREKSMLSHNATPNMPYCKPQKSRKGTELFLTKALYIFETVKRNDTRRQPPNCRRDSVNAYYERVKISAT